MLETVRQTRFPVTLVQEWYEKSDPSLLSPDFICTAVGYGTKQSVYKGSEGMLKEFFGEIGDKYDEWSLTMDRMIDAGQSIIVLGKYDSKPKNGELTKLPFIHVWDISDSRIRSVTCFTDTSNSSRQ